jgi:hypothetical protein
MATTLADRYHDEQGRPITPPTDPSPRIVPPRQLESWQIRMRERADAERNARALGALAMTPAARANYRANNLAAAEQRKTDLRTARRRNPIANAPPVAPAAAPEQPPAAAEAERVATAARAAKALADPPGTPTAAELIQQARANKAETALFKFAHEARGPWQPSQWSAALRLRLADALAAHIRITVTPKPKGPKK